MRARASRWAGVAVLACLLGVLGAAPAAAHPLGNFTTNTYGAVVVEPSAVRLDLVIDRAEIPTRQTFPQLDDRTGRLPGGTEREVQDQCQALVTTVAVDADGRRLPLRSTTGQLEFPPGATGLRTARLTCALRTTDDVDLLGATVTVTVEPVTGGPGWREVTAVGDGVRLAGSNVPRESVSEALRSYPRGPARGPARRPVGRLPSRTWHRPGHRSGVGYRDTKARRDCGLAPTSGGQVVTAPAPVLRRRLCLAAALRD